MSAVSRGRLDEFHGVAAGRIERDDQDVGVEEGDLTLRFGQESTLRTCSPAAANARRSASRDSSMESTRSVRMDPRL